MVLFHSVFCFFFFLTLHLESILGLLILVQVTIVNSATNDYSVNLCNLFC